jgi:hypothetical protein
MQPGGCVCYLFCTFRETYLGARHEVDGSENVITSAAGEKYRAGICWTKAELRRNFFSAFSMETILPSLALQCSIAVGRLGLRKEAPSQVTCPRGGLEI